MQHNSFSDSDTTGESTTEDARTQSDYDHIWLMGLVKQVDAFMCTHCTDARMLGTWGAVQNMISMQHDTIRALHRSLENAEAHALRIERARDRADADLIGFRALIAAEINALCMSDAED